LGSRLAGDARRVLAGTRENRLALGRRIGADDFINVTTCNAVEAVQDLARGAGVDLVMECSGAGTAINDAVYATKRGGRSCLAAFPHDQVLFDAAHLVRNNIYLYGVRGEG
jgi:L-iditol 2-dehydrogenase